MTKKEDKNTPEVESFLDPFENSEGWECATSRIWQPSEGEKLTGVYDGHEAFTEGTLDTEVLKHFVNAADGTRWSFVGGQSFDRAIEKAGIVAGYLVKIQFLGQKDTKKEGRRVNLFDVRFKKK